MERQQEQQKALSKSVDRERKDEINSEPRLFCNR